MRQRTAKVSLFKTTADIKTGLTPVVTIEIASYSLFLECHYIMHFKKMQPFSHFFSKITFYC